MDYIIVSLVLFALIYWIIIRQQNNGSNANEDSDTDGSSSGYYSRHEYIPPPIKQYWEVIEEVPVHARMQIVYQDAKQEKTDRTVQISKYDGSCYLHGFCELRNERRMFRIDRIQEWIDTDTGEIVKSVPDHLYEKHKSSPEYKISKVFKDHSDVINVLYYVGKADGQLRREEREIIYQTVCSTAKDRTLEYEIVNQRLNNLWFITQMSTCQHEDHRDVM